MRFALLFAALTVAGCAEPSGAPGLHGDGVLLQVVASGRTETLPDEVRITVGLANTATTAAAANGANAEVMTRLTAALAGLGVLADDLQTRNISLARIDYGPQRGRFRADNLVDVRIRDIAR